MRTLLLALILVAALPAAAQELDAQQESRYRALVQELRCLVCQNQTIAESNAPLAEDLREQVRSQILAGKSDGEITAYMTARYGDFVLYRPQFKGTTALLWLAPLLLVILGGAIAVRIASRKRATAAAASVDAKRLQQLLEGKGSR